VLFAAGLCAEKKIALAQRFTDAVKTTGRLLASHPWIGNLEGWRSWLGVA
jgi:hypothetical protein